MINKMIIEGATNVAGVYEMATREGIPLYNGSSIEVGDALSRHVYNLKRNKYMDTNKRILQEAYDRGDLVFKVIHKSAYSDEVRNMTIQQKEDLQKALSVIEQFNIELNKTTVCNKQRTVTKHSSNKDKFSTYKRRNANTGINNPNRKYDSELIANILWLKEQEFKPKKIVEMLLEQDIEVNKSYISALGVQKWIFLKSKKPNWFDESEVI